MTINGADLFNLGDKIEISRINRKSKLFYPSQILDVLDDEIFVVSGPIHKNRYIFFHRGEQILITCIVENMGKYVFEAVVLNRYNSKVYGLKIQKTSDIRKFQQRSFYRLSIEIPVAKIFKIKKDKYEHFNIESCKTKDISGNGMRLYSNFKHDKEDVIICEFSIGKELINTKAKVLRIEKIDSFEYDYSLGIYFIGLQEKDRDKIIKLIFAKQRELRKKGMM